MDVLYDDGPDIPPWIIFAVAACEPLANWAGCHVAPNIPARASAGALRSYLRLKPDEILLAVIDPSVGRNPHGGCALTSRRICWSDKFAQHEPESAPAANDEGPALTWQAARWGRSLDYIELPEEVVVRGSPSRTLDLGGGQELAPARLEGGAFKTLAWVLTKLRRGARTGDLAGAVSPETIARARAAVAGIVRRSEQVRQVVEEVGSFHALARAATPRVVVTPVLVAACVLVYLAMAFRGISPMNPTTRDLFDWGANMGYAVALDGQPWRLLTSVFLHAGLIHLAFNMWVLVQDGPLIERLFGNVGFALLYLAGGLGGSLASDAVHPLGVGVGASGAIFGIIGGLLAFLLVHRAAIPATVLRPMRGSVLGFVIYNNLYGFLSTGIDNAAHIGGLATGFVAGLLLSRPWPVPRPSAGLIRQLAGAGLLALGLALFGVYVNIHVRRAPEIVAIQRKIQAPVDAYNALIHSLKPILDRDDQIVARLDKLVAKLEGTPTDDTRLRPTLDRLIAEAEANRVELDRVTTPDPDLKAMRGSVAEGQADLIRAMKALRRWLDAPDESTLLDGPEGYVTYQKRSDHEFERFGKLGKDYVAKHHIVLKRADPNAM